MNSDFTLNKISVASEKFAQCRARNLQRVCVLSLVEFHSASKTAASADSAVQITTQRQRPEAILFVKNKTIRHKQME